VRRYARYEKTVPCPCFRFDLIRVIPSAVTENGLPAI
jgi:hypothetical protein